MLNLKNGTITKAYLSMPYLLGHDELGLQNWGHHPTKRSIVLCAQASGLVATHSRRQPLGNDCNCLGWDLLPLQGKESEQMLGPAIRSVSI